MRKHEINYHERTNIIEFISDFCTHSREIKTKTTTKTSNKEKIFFFEKKSFLSQSDHVKSDSLNKNSKSMIVIKVLFRKKVKSDQSAIDLSRKDKKATTSIDKSENLYAVRDFRLNLNELEISNSKKKKSSSVMNIAMIKTSAFNIMSKRKNVNLFSVTLKNVEKHLKKHNKSNTVMKDVLSSEYHKFLNVFDKKAFNTFVSHRSYDHKIVLEKNAILEYTSLYKMFEEKLKIVKKYLENNLEKKFIIASCSSFVSSVMFMKKTNESLRFCVDYRKLNQLTKKNRYSLLLIDEILTHLEKTKYFTKLNIR